jgi:hypothetical protein
MRIVEVVKRIWKADAFSPEAFLARAVIVVVLYASSRMAGLQEYTTFLSGTPGNVNVNWHTGVTLGLIHLALYFGFILAAPIFLMTAGLLAGWRRYWNGKVVSV